jgi:signal peptidase I
LKKIIGWTFAVIMSLLVLAFLFVMLAPQFGWALRPVLGPSMEPTLKIGGLIITEPVPFETIKVGDIITFQNGKDLETHRVVKAVTDKNGQQWFQTKGDANKEVDAILIGPNADGKINKTIVHVSSIGYLVVFLKNRMVFMAFSYIIAAALIVLLARDLLKEISKNKKGGNTKSQITNAS